MMRDAANNIQVKRVLSPVSVSGNTPQVGQIIDRQGYDQLGYLILTGAIGASPDAGATFAVLLEEGNDSGLSDASTVADADMISQTSGTAPLTAAGFTSGSDDQVRKLSYVGGKRYTRLTITPSGNAGTALLAACAVLGRPGSAPVTQGSS
jgi:hypothetical protein